MALISISTESDSGLKVLGSSYIVSGITRVRVNVLLDTFDWVFDLDVEGFGVASHAHGWGEGCIQLGGTFSCEQEQRNGIVGYDDCWAVLSARERSAPPRLGQSFNALHPYVVHVMRNLMTAFRSLMDCCCKDEVKHARRRGFGDER